MFAYCGNNPITAIDATGHALSFISATNDHSENTLPPPPDDYRTYEDDGMNEHNNCYSYAFDLPCTENPGYTIKDIPRIILKPIIRISYGSKSPSKSVAGMALLVIIDMKNLNKGCRIIRSPSDARMGEYVVAMKTTDYIEAYSRVDYHFAVLLSDGTWADKMGDDPVRRNEINGYASSWPYSDTNSYCSPTVFFAVGG